MKKQIFWGITEALALAYFYLMAILCLLQGDWVRLLIAIVFMMIVIKVNL